LDQFFEDQKAATRIKRWSFTSERTSVSQVQVSIITICKVCGSADKLQLIRNDAAAFYLKVNFLNARLGIYKIP
jgi:hypothetical protein